MCLFDIESRFNPFNAGFHLIPTSKKRENGANDIIRGWGVAAVQGVYIAQTGSWHNSTHDDCSAAHLLSVQKKFRNSLRHSKGFVATRVV